MLVVLGELFVEDVLLVLIDVVDGAVCEVVDTVVELLDVLELRAC